MCANGFEEVGGVDEVVVDETNEGGLRDWVTEVSGNVQVVGANWMASECRLVDGLDGVSPESEWAHGRMEWLSNSVRHSRGTVPCRSYFADLVFKASSIWRSRVSRRCRTIIGG